MKESNPTSFFSLQTKLLYLNYMKRLYSFYSLNPLPCIQELIDHFSTLCNEEEFPAFSTEAKLSFSFTDALYIPVETRRFLANASYMPTLDMKKLPYLSIYATEYVQHTLNEQSIVCVLHSVYI